MEFSLERPARKKTNNTYQELIFHDMFSGHEKDLHKDTAWELLFRSNFTFSKFIFFNCTAKNIWYTPTQKPYNHDTFKKGNFSHQLGSKLNKIKGWYSFVFEGIIQICRDSYFNQIGIPVLCQDNTGQDSVRSYSLIHIIITFSHILI